METYDWYTWVILPLVIFLTRILDVTLGTGIFPSRSTMPRQGTLFGRKSK